MPTMRDRYVDVTTDQRQERLADLLARGLVRHLRHRRPRQTDQKALKTGDSGLELSTEMRLSVSTLRNR